MHQSNVLDNLKIKDTNPLGYGIADTDGKIIFVKSGVEGDTCRAKITAEKKKYSVCELVSVSDPSPHRITPDCSIFASCGGCTLRHINYDCEKEIKKRYVSSSLRRFGLKNAKVNDLLGDDIPSYRNKAVFHLSRGKAGFYKEDSNDIVQLPENGCPLLTNDFCEIAKASANYFSDKDALSLTLRISTSGEILANLSCETGKIDAEGFESFLFSRFPEIAGVGFSRDIFSPCHRESGKNEIYSEISGLKYVIGHSGFFQINYSGMEHIIREISRLTSSMEISSCLDLYCGSGTLGLSVASKRPNISLTGIEINKSSVEYAKKNAEINSVFNAEFICSDASAFLTDKTYDLVIVDPPRSGMSEKSIKVVSKCSEKYIIYVSCNPMTLARDLSSLKGLGFEPYNITPINMFPRTSHVETVVGLTKL